MGELARAKAGSEQRVLAVRTRKAWHHRRARKAWRHGWCSLLAHPRAFALSLLGVGAGGGTPSTSEVVAQCPLQLYSVV